MAANDRWINGAPLADLPAPTDDAGTQDWWINGAPTQGLGAEAVANQAPIVEAGPAQTIYGPLAQAFTLAGSAFDDGLPDPPATLTYLWEQISGPGTATFVDDTDPTTDVSFDAYGAYVLQLTADDSLLDDTDTVTITLGNHPPVADAGPDQNVTLFIPVTTTLAGSATDDGFPDPPAALTFLWEKVSGPGTVTFVDDTDPTTNVEFDDYGTYVLRLTADDSLDTHSDTVTIVVILPKPARISQVAVEAASQNPAPFSRLSQIVAETATENLAIASVYQVTVETLRRPSVSANAFQVVVEVLVLVPDREPEWTNIANWEDIPLRVDDFMDGIVHVNLTMWTGNAGTTMRARLWNVTTSTSLGESAEVTGVTPTDIVLSAVLTDELSDYRIQVIADRISVDLFAVAQLVGGTAP